MIAQYWIELESASESPLLGLNMTDKQRPWADTFGNAVRIYNRMRLDDPTGKLADDATIVDVSTESMFVAVDLDDGPAVAAAERAGVASLLFLPM